MSGLTTSMYTTENNVDHVYVNINCSNLTGVGQPLRFQQTLGVDLVNNPHDYYLSCVRFSLSGQSLPIFTFEDNKWYVVLTWGPATSGPIDVQHLYAPQFGDPAGVYSYQEFIECINAAYVRAFAALKIAAPATPGVAPYMLYDCTTNLISLYADANYLDSATVPVKIFQNQYLYYFFNNFLTEALGEDLPTKMDYQIIVRDLHGSNSAPLAPSVPAGFYRMSAEYPAPSRFNSVARLAFISSTMGCRTEWTQGINNSSSSLVSNQTAGSGLPQISLLTDFIPNLTIQDAAGLRSELVYTPVAQYRLIDLIGTQSNNLDLNVVWFDYQNNQHQFNISPAKAATIKLLFVHRSVYKNRPHIMK